MLRRALELEKQIQQVQKSTRTLFKFFVPIHNWLRMRSKSYYNWSIKPYSHAIHWVVLILFITATPLAFMARNGRPEVLEAAGIGYSETFYNPSSIDMDKTTAKIDVANGKARMAYMQEPSTLGTLAIPYDYIFSNKAYIQTVYVDSTNSNSNKDTIYVFGGQTTNSTNVVIKITPSDSSVIMLSNVETHAENFAFTSATRMAYDYDDGIVYFSSGETIFSFNLAIDQFLSAPANSAEYYTASYAGDSKNAAVSGQLGNSMPVYIPKSSETPYAGKVLFVGGQIHNSTVGTDQIAVLDPSSNSFESSFDSGINFQMEYRDATNQINNNNNLSVGKSTINFSGIGPTKALAQDENNVEYSTNTNGGDGDPDGGGTGIAFYKIYANNLYGGSAYYSKDAGGQEHLIFNGNIKYYYYSNTVTDANGEPMDIGGLGINGVGDLSSVNYNFSDFSKLTYAKHCPSSYGNTIVNKDNSTQIYHYANNNFPKLLKCSLNTDTFDVSSDISFLPEWGTVTSAVFNGTDQVYLFFLPTESNSDFLILTHNLNTDEITDGTLKFGTTDLLKSNFAVIPQDSKAYLFGGANNEGSLYNFDPVSKTLEQTGATDPSVNLDKNTLGAYVGEKYYTFTNSSGGSFSNGHVKVYENPTSATPTVTDIINTSPSELASALQFQSASRTAAVSYNDKIYFLGDFLNSSALSAVFVYDPALNSISQAADLSSVLPYNNNEVKLAAVGNDGSSDAIYIFNANKIIKFNPVNNSFSTILSDPEIPFISLGDGGAIYTASSNDDKSKIYIAASKSVNVFDVPLQKYFNTAAPFKYTHFSEFNLGRIFAHGNEVFYFGGNTDKIETANLRIKPATNVVQSKNIYANKTGDIYKINFAAYCYTPDHSCNYSDGRNVKFEVTKNGVDWEEIDQNGDFTFARNSLVDNALAADPDLRWRATLTGTEYSTPEITRVNITTYGAQSRLMFRQPSISTDLTKKAGVSTGEFRILLRDANNYSTIASQDTTITLSSNSPKGRFSTSPSGPWTENLQVIIPKDQEYASFYYLNFETGTHRITASSPRMIGTTYSINTLVGDLGSASKIEFNSPVQVGQHVPITITLLDSQSPPNTISDKTVRIFSSNPNDSITQPSGATVDGIATGSINGTVAGNRTISVLDETDNTWLETQPTLTFLPGPVNSITVSSSQKEFVQAGTEFSITATLLDANKNHVYTSSGTVSLTSTDPQFQSQTSNYNSGNGGVIIFPKISLKKNGPQTITVTDNGTGITGSLELKVFSGTLDSSHASFTTDKEKLILNHDKANLTIRINDAYGNSVANTNVHIKEDFQYGTLSATNATTNKNGLATFVYTPTKLGRETLSAYTDAFEIRNKVVIENVTDTLANQLGSLVDSLQNNTIAKAIAKAANALVAATASLGLIPIVAGIISGAPAAAHAITYTFSLGLEAIGAKKRRRSWGRVYDSTTGEGIDMATVRLFDQKTMRLISTVVTDLKGHFSFQPEAGKYTISVIKDSYVFPTNIFAKYGVATIDKSVSRINSRYVGQTIEVSGDNNLINLEIPIDPHNKKPTFMVRAKVFINDFFEMVTSGLSYIFMPSIVLGALLSVFAAVILPTVRNQTICLTYLLVALLYIISHLVKVRKFSVVYDQRDKKPIPEAVVSIFEKQYDALKETRITDKFGRFSISVPKGNYRIKVEREGFIFPSIKAKKHYINDGRYTNLYFGDTIEAKKEKFINVSVPMDEKYGDLTIK